MDAEHLIATGVVDNVVFISILSNRLPEEQQGKARRAGLALAMAGRIVLLFSLGWVMKLEDDLFSIGIGRRRTFYG